MMGSKDPFAGAGKTTLRTSQAPQTQHEPPRRPPTCEAMQKRYPYGIGPRETERPARGRQPSPTRLRQVNARRRTDAAFAAVALKIDPQKFALSHIDSVTPTPSLASGSQE